MHNPNDDVTEILKDWGTGGDQALERLIPLVYDELHRRARQLFRHERRNHTLQPTALVHEACLRLMKRDPTTWENRSHFFRVATRSMRETLIDHARKRLAEKRSGSMAMERLEDLEEKLPSQQASEFVVLGEALETLRKLDSRQCEIVELRFFGGLTIEETAQTLGCSIATVNREWRSARVWLRLQLKKGEPVP